MNVSDTAYHRWIYIDVKMLKRLAFQQGTRVITQLKDIFKEMGDTYCWHIRFAIVHSGHIRIQAIVLISDFSISVMLRYHSVRG